MASTAHKTAAEYVEHFDTEDVLDEKVKKLAGWMRSSRYTMAFTGAGISTACGIPDFRSGMNTVLQTGAGAWTIRAEEQKTGKRVDTGTRRVSTLKALPSKKLTNTIVPAHMSLVQLEKANLLHWLVSQNTDGLHRRSGFPVDKFSELHGNSNLERCPKCEHEYLRDFGTRNAREVHDHRTGRMCARCGTELEDTIINFGESLPAKHIGSGFAAARKAEVCLALGSSLRVTPAANIPAIVGGKPDGKLVIVNLQETPLDDIADMRINATIDTVFEKLMPLLNQPIPPFVLRRRMVVTQSTAVHDDDPVSLQIQGIDTDGTPCSLWRSVRIGKKTAEREPHTFQIERKGGSEEEALEVTLQPFGHYNEPPLTIRVPVRPGTSLTYLLEYDPVETGQWIKAEVVDDECARETDAAASKVAKMKI